MDQDETDRVSRLRALAERNFMRVRSGAGGELQITAGARGRVVSAGDLGAVERWLLRYDERIDAEVRRATQSEADIELAEIAGSRPASGGSPGDHPGLAPPGRSDVDAAAVVHCAVITSQLAALSELLFRNPSALLGSDPVHEDPLHEDPLRIGDFTQLLRRAADTLDGLRPGR